MNIIQVVSSRQRRLGYIINNDFIPANILDNACSDIVISKTVFGVFVENKLLTDIGVFDLMSDYLDILVSLRNLISYNSISFIQRVPLKDELCYLSSFWKAIDIKRRYVYTVIDSSVNILGYIITNKDITRYSDCYICMIEVLDKGIGVGTRIVSKFLTFSSIRGYSCITAVDFWKSFGAIFTKDNHFKIPRNI